jgi:hypothetical protein
MYDVAFLWLIVKEEKKLNWNGALTSETCQKIDWNLVHVMLHAVWTSKIAFHINGDVLQVIIK